MEISFVQVDTRNSDHIDAVSHMIMSYFRCSNSISLEQFDFSYDIESMHDDFINTLHNYSDENGGKLFLCKRSDEIIGFGGFHLLDNSTAELNRIYVKPQHRGNQYGHQILSKLIDEAGESGYQKLVLESARYLKAAFHLYEKFGFREIPPYTGAESPRNSINMRYYMELPLK